MVVYFSLLLYHNDIILALYYFMPISYVLWLESQLKFQPVLSIDKLPLSIFYSQTSEAELDHVIELSAQRRAELPEKAVSFPYADLGTLLSRTN